MSDPFPLKGAQLKAEKALALARRGFVAAQSRYGGAQRALQCAEQQLALLMDRHASAHKRGAEPRIQKGWQVGALGDYAQGLRLKIAAKKEERTCLEEALERAEAGLIKAKSHLAEAQNRVDVFKEKRREWEDARKRAAMDAADEEVEESYAWKSPTE